MLKARNTRENIVEGQDGWGRSDSLDMLEEHSALGSTEDHTSMLPMI